MRLVDADALYKAMQDAEELARRRVRDTESTLPYHTNLNPAYTRYLAQMDERTKAKHMIADALTVDAVPVIRCKNCKYWRRDTDHTCKEHSIVSPMLADGFCSRGERKDGDGNG